MFPNQINQTYQSSQSEVRLLSAFMSQVYLWMMVAITISGITAYAVSTQPMLIQAVTTPAVFYGIMFAQIAAVLLLSFGISRLSVGIAAFLFAAYATLVGLTASTLFLIYTNQSIASVFFITAFAFAGISVVGYTTKRDLGPIGTFCTIGLFGLIGVMLVSIFVPSMQSNSMQVGISIAGVIIFAGLTAYDTQRIKNLQVSFDRSAQSHKRALIGALTLYLDFINLFFNLMRILGDRR